MSETARHILTLIGRGERAQAERILRKLGAEALPVLRELLEHPLRAEKKSRWLYWLLPMLATPFLLFALWGSPEYAGGLIWKWPAALFPMSSDSSLPEWILAWLFLCTIPGLLVALGFNLGLYAATQFYRGLTYTLPHPQGQELAAQVLTQIEDVRAVGPLLEMVNWLRERLPKATINAGRETLIRLLPHLSQETAPMLTQDQRRALLSLLREHSLFTLDTESEENTPRGIPYSRYDVPLSLAILRVYTLIGDSHALGFVERLAAAIARPHVSLEGKPINKTSAQCVIDKARSVLPKLRAQCEALRTGESLLRAASKPEAAPEELLRPTQGSQETPPEQLLRAGKG